MCCILASNIAFKAHFGLIFGGLGSEPPMYSIPNESDSKNAVLLNNLKPFFEQFGEVSSPVQVGVPGHGGAYTYHAAQGPAAIN